MSNEIANCGAQVWQLCNKSRRRFIAGAWFRVRVSARDHILIWNYESLLRCWEPEVAFASVEGDMARGRGRGKGKRNTWQEYAKDVWVGTASCCLLACVGLPWLGLPCCELLRQDRVADSCCQTRTHTAYKRERERERGGYVAYEIISSVTSIVNSLHCCRWRYLSSCLRAWERWHWAGSEATSTPI